MPLGFAIVPLGSCDFWASWTANRYIGSWLTRDYHQAHLMMAKVRSKPTPIIARELSPAHNSAPAWVKPFRKTSLTAPHSLRRRIEYSCCAKNKKGPAEIRSLGALVFLV
jgi:hypothetical protein